MSIETEPSISAEMSSKDEEIKPKKRFVLGKEPFARERIEAIKSAVEQMQSENPEVLGLSLFGSTVKGKHVEASDIDGFLFVDAELAAEKYNVPVYDLIQQKSYTIALSEPYSKDYEDLVEKSLEKYKKQIKILPINQEIIDNEIDKIRSGTQFTPLRNLTAIFHLKTGHGIEKYRKYLVEELIRMDDQGEEVWHQIIDETERWEEGKSREFGQKQYPRTLKEAKELYL